MEKSKINCSEANQIDLVDYLSGLGYHPQRIRGKEYWYLSPLREEKTASFKIDRKLNLWYDHGLGKGGSLVDFGIQFHRCSVSELLGKLSTGNQLNFSFQPQINFEQEKIPNEQNKIMILDEKIIQSSSLKQYLSERCIPLEMARRFCKEVEFKIGLKTYFAIGFKNDSGGYEIRNKFFKGSSAPKDVTHIYSQAKIVSVFEGFFSFLSYQTLKENQHPLFNSLSESQSDFLILNSLSFFEKSRSLMEEKEKIHLHLDRDTAGQKFTKEALGWSEKYQDRSQHYEKYKDLNEYLIQCYDYRQKISMRPGKTL